MHSFGRGNRTAQTPRAARLALRVALIALPLLALLSTQARGKHTRDDQATTRRARHAMPIHRAAKLLTTYGRMISTLTLSTNWACEGASASNSAACRGSLRCGLPKVSGRRREGQVKTPPSRTKKRSRKRTRRPKPTQLPKRRAKPRRQPKLRLQKRTAARRPKSRPFRTSCSVPSRCPTGCCSAAATGT